MRRRRLTLAAVVAMALVWSSGAHAAPLTFSGSFRLVFPAAKFGVFPTMAPVALAGIAVANTPGQIVLGGNAVLTPTQRIFDLAANVGIPVTKAQVANLSNGAGTLALSGAGQLPMRGNLRLQAYGGAVNLVSIPLVAGPGTPSGCNAPFVGGMCTTFTFTTAASRGLGLGGAPILSSGYGIIAYLHGGAWTAHTATVVLPGTTPSGGTTFVLTPMTATAMGADARTVGGAGSVTFVTPLLIPTNLENNVAAFGELTLTFVPEPGTLALVVLGLGAVAVGARQRA